MERNYRFVNNLNMEINNEYIEILNGTKNAPNRFKVFERLRRKLRHENNARIEIRNVSTNLYMKDNGINGLIKFFENLESTHHIHQNQANLQRQEFLIQNKDSRSLLDTTSDVIDLPIENQNSEVDNQEKQQLVSKLIVLYETLRNEQNETVNPRNVSAKKLIINEDFKKKLEEIVENTYKVLKSLSCKRESTSRIDINIEQKISGFRDYRRTLHA